MENNILCCPYCGCDRVCQNSIFYDVLKATKEEKWIDYEVVSSDFSETISGLYCNCCSKELNEEELILLSEWENKIKAKEIINE